MNPCTDVGGLAAEARAENKINQREQHGNGKRDHKESHIND